MYFVIKRKSYSGFNSELIDFVKMDLYSAFHCHDGIFPFPYDIDQIGD